MKRILTLVSLGLFLVSSQAFAVGDAGCGLGSLVWKDNAKLVQLFAVTTNGTFASQTFGITSGTSNCSAHGLVMNDQDRVNFVEANYPKLQVDMARGQGETLSTLAEVLGCNGSAVGKLGRMTQEQFPSLFPTEGASAAQLLNGVRERILKNPDLAVGCGVS